jgi:hypothetical protein
MQTKNLLTRFRALFFLLRNKIWKIAFLVVLVTLTSIGLYLVLSNSSNIAMAAGNTYYVRADGTLLAANKANATSPDSPNTALSMAQVKVASFSAGDRVLFSSQGGNYVEILSLPSGGSGVSAEITYANVSGETPVITVSASPIINTNLKSNVKIEGFSIINTGAVNSNAGVRIRGGSNITIRNMNIDMGGYGYNIISYTNSSGPTINNLIIENTAMVNAGSTLNPLYIFNDQGTVNTNISISDVSTGVNNYGIYISNANGLIISTASSTGVFLSSVQSGSISGATIASNLSGNANVATRILNSTAINITNMSYTGNDYPLTITGSSNITLSSISSTGNTTRSWRVNGTSSDITFSNCVQTNAGGYIVTDTANNVTFNDCITTNPGTTGFSALLNAHDITYNNTEDNGGAGGGYIAMDNVYNIRYNKARSINTGGDGFVASDAAHDIAWDKAYSYGNGDKTSASSGDGFTAHGTNYNIYCYSCIAAYNTVSGYAMIDNSSGGIYNSIAYKNSGNWSLEGGSKLDQVRAGFYLQLSGNNPITGLSWEVNNSIGYENYPREIFVNTTPYAVFNYNIYKPTSDNLFATINSGASNISWDTYHSVNGLETNSRNADPLFISSSDYHLQPTSPAIDSGKDLGIATDYSEKQRYDNPVIANTGDVGLFAKDYVDIGAYEYVLPPAPTLSSVTNPSQIDWYTSNEPQITIDQTSPTTVYKYLVNQTLQPAIESVLAGTDLLGATLNLSTENISSEGVWYVHVIALNLDGGFSTNYSTYILKYDSTAPVDFTPTVDSSDSVNGNITLIFETTDIISGIASYRYKIGSGLYGTAITSPYVLDTRSLITGDYIATIIATDYANNIREHSVTFSVDKVEPALYSNSSSTTSVSNSVTEGDISNIIASAGTIDRAENLDSTFSSSASSVKDTSTVSDSGEILPQKAENNFLSILIWSAVGLLAVFLFIGVKYFFKK